MKRLRIQAYTAYHYLLQRSLNTISLNRNIHKTRLCTDQLTNIVKSGVPQVPNPVFPLIEYVWWPYRLELVPTVVCVVGNTQYINI